MTRLRPARPNRPCRPRPAIRPALLLGLALAWLAAPASRAAPPTVPLRVTYQGVLLDGTGAPRTGNVDLTLRIYPGVVGGALIYKQSFTGVPLTDGVFTVELGPTGDATDTPNDPLTTSLADALTSDLGPLAPARFLEVTVGATQPLLRSQILASPYAVRAESAAEADLAQNALSADLAVDAQGVGGLSSDVLTELWEHTNLDGEGPGNAEPTEGLGDPDLDGIANFVDPDNDGDGLTDGVEVSQGSDINLVTPSISAFSPPQADGFVPNTITVQGSGFEPGLAVDFGGESPPPQNLTFTSFEVDVGARAPATVNVVLTNLNGQTVTQPYTFFYFEPQITGLAPSSGASADSTSVTVFGSDLAQVQTVTFGSENVTPFNVTNGQFDAIVGPQLPGVVDVTVTLANGNSDVLTDGFEFLTGTPHAVAFVAGSTHLTFDAIPATGRTILGGEDEYGVDTDGNTIPELIRSFPSNGQLAVAYTPAGAVAGVRCRSTGANACDVEYRVDSDADHDLADETPAVIEALDGTALLLSPTLEFDPAGRPVIGYVARTFGTSVAVAHDRNGDGDFADASEWVEVLSSIGPPQNRAAEVAVDPSGQVAHVFYSNIGLRLRVAYDRNGDGDYEDTVGSNPELFDVVDGIAAPPCVGATFDPSGHLNVVYGETGGSATLVRDLNGDGDFADAGESAVLPGSGEEGCDVDFPSGGFLTVVLGDANGVDVLIDRTGDGDFDDTDETATISTTSTVDQLELRVDTATSRALIGTATEVHSSAY